MQIHAHRSWAEVPRVALEVEAVAMAEAVAAWAVMDLAREGAGTVGRPVAAGAAEVQDDSRQGSDAVHSQDLPDCSLPSSSSNRMPTSLHSQIPVRLESLCA